MRNFLGNILLHSSFNSFSSFNVLTGFYFECNFGLIWVKESLGPMMMIDSEGESLDINIDEPEAVAQRCSVKKVFLKISQNSQENTCARPCFLIKLPQACNYIKNETGTGVFLRILQNF